MNEINKVKRKYSVLEDIPLGVCILKKDNTVLFWNKTLVNISTVSKESIIGKNITDLYPDFQKKSYNILINDIFNGGPPLTLSSQLHKSIFHPKTENTKNIAHNIIIQAIQTDIEDEYYALFTVEDVTGLTKKILDYKSMRDKALEEIEQRKVVEQKLLESQKELQNLNATKDKFFSIIAHDLKNPISAFKGITDLLNKSFDDFSDDELKEFIDDISVSSKQLFKLLDNLLMWSRTQTGKMKIIFDNIDLYSIVESNISLMNLNAEDKKIELINNIPFDTFVYGDYNMLQTVVRNLISNAIKFTNTGGTVTINSFDNEDHLLVSVTDNGVGMSNEIIEKLFRIDTQITVVGTKNEKGTGLGLILCKEFIEKNNGKIWVESEINKGSTFYFTVPKINNELLDDPDFIIL